MKTIIIALLALTPVTGLAKKEYRYECESLCYDLDFDFGSATLLSQPTSSGRTLKSAWDRLKRKCPGSLVKSVFETSRQEEATASHRRYRYDRGWESASSTSDREEYRSMDEASMSSESSSSATIRTRRRVYYLYTYDGRTLDVRYANRWDSRICSKEEVEEAVSEFDCTGSEPCSFIP